MKNLVLLLSCVALPASAEVVARPISAVPALGVSGAAYKADVLAQLPRTPLAVLPASMPAMPALSAAPAAAAAVAATPVPAATAAATGARAALVAAAPALNDLPAGASGESRASGGRIVFDHAGSPAAGLENPTPVLGSAGGEARVALKPAAPAKTPALAAAFGPGLLTAAQGEPASWVPFLVLGALAIGVFLLLRWSKNNLRQITEQEISEFKMTIEGRKAEWLTIPGVKGIEIIPISRMDDTPPAYLRIIVDHIGPDNKDLLPQNHQRWSPVIASMFPRPLREAARIGSLDGNGYWPIAVDIAR